MTPQRLLLKLVLAVSVRPRLTLLLVLVVVLACVLLASLQLRLSSNQNELFSSRVKFFREYLNFIEDFPENEAIFVVIEPVDAEQNISLQRWTSAADAVAGHVAALDEHVRLVDHRVTPGQLGRQALRFASPSQVQQSIREIREFIPLAQLWSGRSPSPSALPAPNPIERFLTAVRMGPTDPETAKFVYRLAASWTRTLSTSDQSNADNVSVPNLDAFGAETPRDLGYYFITDRTDADRSMLLIRVFHETEHRGLTAVTQAVDAIREAVEDAAAEFPTFRVGVTGRPVLEAEQMRAADQGTRRAEIVALITVFFGLVLLLRSVWLAIVAEITLVVGIACTLGFATLTLGRLNLLSIVFLLALIGIGMDSLIQILSRYRVAYARSGANAVTWLRVYQRVGPAINTAILGAATAFYVSLFTSFRGAAELGLLAGTGLLLCLAAGYIVLPAVLSLKQPRRTRLAVSAARPDPARTGRPSLIPVGLWAIILAAGIPFMNRVTFETELLNLQGSGLESVQLVRKLPTWYAVVLSPDLSTLRDVRSALQKGTTVKETESLLDAYDNAARLEAAGDSVPAIDWSEPGAVTPGELTALARGARRLANHYTETVTPGDEQPADVSVDPLSEAATALHAFAEALEQADASMAATRLSQWQSAFVNQLRTIIGRLNPPPLEVDRLPDVLRRRFVSDDGLKALYVYPRHNLWDHDHLSEFVEEVESLTARATESNPHAEPIVTGIADNIHHTTRSICQSFYVSTILAVLLILTLVSIDMRSIGLAAAALSVLALGLPMLVAIMGCTGVNWNFANFFGLPILIGAAHEYGVFLVHRYLEARDNPNRAWIGWDSTDHALLLCAFVTSSSFGFLTILARHDGLQSLGFVMAVGAACVYLAAVLVLRPILKRRLARLADSDTVRR